MTYTCLKIEDAYCEHCGEFGPCAFFCAEGREPGTGYVDEFTVCSKCEVKLPRRGHA